jgi:hypothetical protein
MPLSFASILANGEAFTLPSFDAVETAADAETDAATEVEAVKGVAVLGASATEVLFKLFNKFTMVEDDVA